MYLRTVKVRSSSGTVNEYVRVVEAYRDYGKVKQRILADLGCKDLLAKIFPMLQRILGCDGSGENAEHKDLDIIDASTWGLILAVRALFDQLRLWSVLDATLGKAKGVPFADRAFVLIANRLTHPASEHGLAGSLETDFVCDCQKLRFIPRWHQHNPVRVHFQQLEAWYRTLDQLVAAKEQIEVALYHRLRDLFSFKPDLVLYDITSTYFEGQDHLFRQARPQPRSQAAQCAGDRRSGDGRWLANRPSRLRWQRGGSRHRAEGHPRFAPAIRFNRLVFVGDRGMVTDANITAIISEKNSYLVGLKRRRNKKLNKWLDAVDEAKWISCPVGITAQEKTNPPRTRPGSPFGNRGMR